jgi:hypothetical protein
MLMSATDPVRSIRVQEHESPIAVNLPETLKRLAALPPQPETPYLTVTLDWRPLGDEPGRRPSKIEAWNDIKPEIDQLPWRSEAAQSLNADVERIAAYLNSELDPAAQGVVVISNAANEVFEAVPLGITIPTSATIAPIPALNRLTRVIEDNPLYAILVLDQQQAILSFVMADVLTGSVSVKANDYPRNQKQGGWSQQRFQARAGERIDAFTRTVAEQTQRALDATGVRRLIVSSDEVSGPPLMDAFHDTVKEKIIGTFRTDIDLPFHEHFQHAQPIAEEYERKREAEAVEAVSDAVGSGNRGAAGPEAVLQALQNGQVFRLVMVGRYEQPGWADYSMPVYGVGHPPKTHPAGGDVEQIVPVALEEEMIRQAILTDAQIELVWGYLPVGEDQPIPDAGESAPRREASDQLEEMGGVAALLRW